MSLVWIEQIIGARRTHLAVQLFSRTKSLSDPVGFCKFVIGLLALVSLCLVVSFAGDDPKFVRPKTWAQPIKLSGVDNLCKVTDSLYRSAQPTEEGMKSLKELGIKTVVNLRAFHSDRDEIGKTELAYEHIAMVTWEPEIDEAVRFLKIVTDKNRTPVLVHCQHGADRTGALMAVYRVTVENWSKDEAIREMTEGEFGFHEVWSNLPVWIRDLDIEAIRKEAGLDNLTETPGKR